MLSESSSEDEDEFDVIMKDKKEKLNHEVIKDFDAAWPLAQQFAAEQADPSFYDVVHDNTEIYPIATEKHGGKAGVKCVRARCEGGEPSGDMMEWPSNIQRLIRGDTKMLQRC